MEIVRAGVGDVPVSDSGSGEPDGAVIVDENGLLVTGNREFVDSYIARLTAVAHDAVSVADVSAKSVADAAALATLGAGFLSKGGEYVRLSSKSRALLEANSVIPGEPGFYLPTVTRLGSHLFAGQLQWQPVAVNPAQAANAQMMMVMIALRTAIAAVEDAVDRVDGKVTAILTLVEADRAGDIVGLYRTLRRIADQYDDTGILTRADWDSIAGLGPELDRATARLRSFISKSLDGFDPTASIADRADFLERLVQQKLINETLQLLVVAQDAAYAWHRLKIAHMSKSEPEHLDIAIATVNRAMRSDLEADAELLNAARKVLNEYTAIKPLEFLRRWSAKSVHKNAETLKEGLDDFAEARRTQVADWHDHEMPGFSDAFSEIKRRAVVGGEIVGEVGTKAIDAGFAGLATFGAGLQSFAERHSRESVPVPAEESTRDAAAKHHTETENDDVVEDSARSAENR